NYANYQEAAAEVRIARASLFPTVGATGQVTRERAGNGSPGINSGSLEGNASWAPDLWGQVRRTIEENSASAQASEATLANATLSEQIALANAVIGVRVSDANIDLLKATVDAYQQSLRVVQEQDRAGTVPPTDLLTARTQLENAQASLIALGVARAQDEHAIAVLIGRNPEELDIPHSTALPVLPEIPAGVPSTMLQRRPDVATAERQMAAANAAIGIQIAAYYPDISLSGLVGFTQSPLAGLLKASNYVWSLGGSATETIFDGGLRSAQVDAARASYNAAVAGYRGTVLSAFESVENDLAGLRILASQADALDAAVRDAARGAQIALDEYQAGTVDYTTVATAQTTLLTTRQNALSVQQQRLLDAASLIGDLGGGWNGTLHDPLHDPLHAAPDVPTAASEPLPTQPAAQATQPDSSPQTAATATTPSR
ncbi:MAG TPA: efflux transporter outer membrane subunit, partial [Paraburkholderia sp.]